ncbi:caspase family protein [Planctomicrobium sp. SH527]|uniref:caspase family protein n=1 Tax=Planctomicrobium sp. SH527 TaxID=3448123 RepID=UPI003F5BFFDE
MQRRLSLILCWTAFFGAVACDAYAQNAGTTNPPQHRIALLIGSTTYPECDAIRPLYGPNNDLPLFRNMLKEKFGFQDNDITTLVGWPEVTEQRPTRSNIVNAFSKLIDTAREGSHVVILVSGHGTQVPVPEVNGVSTDPAENDGLNEVYLPADTQRWDGSKLPNAIIDDEFEAWFNALRNNGAHVWVTFDTCHSGTMTRSVDINKEEPIERSRMVRPETLSIPMAKPHLAASAQQNETLISGVQNSSDSQKSLPSRGSLAAFSAAQPFEEAPELPRPAHAPRNPSHYYGLFTYSLVKAIERQKNPFSYQDLSQSILNIYCAERGTRGPTPVFEGDLSRQVLGQQDWKHVTEYPVSLIDDEYRIPAGSLHGMTVGSIVEVREGSGSTPDSRNTQGYLKIVSSTPSAAVAEACLKDGEPAPAPLQITSESRCRIHSQDIGEMRVKLAIYKTQGVNPELEQQLTALLEKLPAETHRLIHLESNAETADWVLQLLPPTTAATEYGLSTTSPVLILSPRGQRMEPTQAASGSNSTPGKNRLIAVHPFPQKMSLESQNSLLHQLSEQLQKIFTWQNVWRISDVAHADAIDSDLKLQLTVKRSGEEIENPSELFSGEKVEVQLSNSGTRDWWVTLMFLGSDLSISQWTTGSIKASSDFRKLRATVDPHTSGAEGFVVFASPISITQQEPRFGFLEQSGLNDSQTNRSLNANPNSPFGKLIDGARTGKATRSLTLDAPDQPSVLLKNWITHPAGSKQ